MEIILYHVQLISYDYQNRLTPPPTPPISKVDPFLPPVAGGWRGVRGGERKERFNLVTGFISIQKDLILMLNPPLSVLCVFVVPSLKPKR
jgi:hypothetical protein